MATRDGFGGLVDGPWRPQSCPYQMVPEVEARILELAGPIPGGALEPSATAWKATVGTVCRAARRSISAWFTTVSSIPRLGAGRRSEDKRWELSRAKNLWQDIVGGVILTGG